MAKKKKKKSAEAMHRQVQDSLQALPYMIDDQKKKGKRFKAFMLRYFTGPMLRVMNKALSARRYRGEEGKKLQQTDRMRRQLEQRQAGMRHVQDYMQQVQRQRRGKPR